MGKASVPGFQISALCMAAIVTIAVGVCTVKFSASHGQRTSSIQAPGEKQQNPALSNEQRGRIRTSLAALPLAFEANQGQTDPHVKYTARANGYSVFLTAHDAVFAISSARPAAARPSRTTRARAPQQTPEKVDSATIDMRLVGGKPDPQITAGDPLPGIVSYYTRSDPRNWHTGVRQYSSISYKEVYPGVNMVFHGVERQLEFDFRVSPGADPKPIALSFQGARKLETDASGNLVLQSSAGNVVLHKPVAYQEKEGKRQVVDAAFRLECTQRGRARPGCVRSRTGIGDRSASSDVGDLSRWGGDKDEAYAIGLDGNRYSYVTG